MMWQFSLNDFHENPAWLLFRVDAFVKDQPIDIYMLMHLPSGFLVASEIAETVLSQKQIDRIINKGRKQQCGVPSRIFLAKGDPAEPWLIKTAVRLSMKVESVSASRLERLVEPVRQSFREEPSQSFDASGSNDIADEMDLECAKKMVPDSYDPCSCASGKKYKFCCKKIFFEIMEAMYAAENGKIAEAFDWLKKARAVAGGDTPELLCCESIVYSYVDAEKSSEFLQKCLSLNPSHPRAHYLCGINLKKHGDLQGAMKEYETAIANYPSTDHFHLNEAYNNLGSVFYSIGDLDKAKSAWEKALLYLPSDKMTRKNLVECIYKNPFFAGTDLKNMTGHMDIRNSQNRIFND